MLKTYTFPMEYIHYCLVLFVVISLSEGREVCCENDACFNNTGIFSHLPLPLCPEEMDITFLLYTSKNQQNPIHIEIDAKNRRFEMIGNDYVFNPSNPVIFSTHGWLGHGELPWLLQQKDAILKVMEANVIIVDWEDGANDYVYARAASTTRSAGVTTARFMEHLVKIYGVKYADIWCIGFSLGAHHCGHAGMNTKEKIGRITGLDPAGPFFAGEDLRVGINPEAAEYVDVIHTDGEAMLLALGLMERRGHADFYPNEGKKQPGCFAMRQMKSIGVKNQSAQYAIGCMHYRAVNFFEETFLDRKCHISSYGCKDEFNIPGSCTKCPTGTCAIMGVDSIKQRPHGIFYLKTKSTAPFCKYGN